MTYPEESIEYAVRKSVHSQRQELNHGGDETELVEGYVEDASGKYHLREGIEAS
jgi:hypothetical protein